MTQVPAGAQLSDDGNWWWDGSQWQPVQGQSESLQTQDPGQQPADYDQQRAGQTLTDDQFAQMIAAAESEATEA